MVSSNTDIKNEWLRDGGSFGLDFVFDRLRPAGPYGKLGFKNLKVFLPGEEAELEEEYDYLENIKKAIERNKIALNIIRGVIGEIKNISGTYERLLQSEILTEVELYELKNFNLGIAKLHKLLNQYNFKDYGEVSISPMNGLAELLDPEGYGNSTFMIYDSYSAKLKELRGKIADLDKELALRDKSITDELKSKFNISPKNGGKYIIDKSKSDLIEELKNDQRLSYVSEDYLKVRFEINEEFIGMELITQIRELKNEEMLEEDNVLVKLSESLAMFTDEISRNIKGLSELDYRISKVILINAFDLIRPNITSDNRITLKGGRHLKTEHNVKVEGRIYTPIDIDLGRGVTCITGANMGGKTVALRMSGQSVLMAQMGFFVPADHMEFSLRNFVAISSGDSQSVETGLSTFGSEIIHIKDALLNSKDLGLILIDELARGTNPVEGTAISKAIISYLTGKNAISVVTTHFEGVGNMDGIEHLQVVGLKKDVLKDLKEEGISSLEKIQMVMDYSLIRADKGASVPKDAIEISRLLGLDDEIIKKAEEFVREDA